MATLREQRVKFTRLICLQIQWMNSQPGWEVAEDEGRVISPRPIWLDGKKVMGPDAVHKHGSWHHDGKAKDLNLYINGKYISDGKHIAWLQAGAHWKSLDPECTWGGDFRNSEGELIGDVNHFSIGEGQ